MELDAHLWTVFVIYPYLSFCVIWGSTKKIKNIYCLPQTHSTYVRLRPLISFPVLNSAPFSLIIYIYCFLSHNIHHISLLFLFVVLHPLTNKIIFFGLVMGTSCRRNITEESIYQQPMLTYNPLLSLNNYGVLCWHVAYYFCGFLSYCTLDIYGCTGLWEQCSLIY